MRSGLPVICGQCGGRLSVELMDGAGHLACERCRWVDAMPARERWRRSTAVTTAIDRRGEQPGAKRVRPPKQPTAAQRRAIKREWLISFIKAGRA